MINDSVSVTIEDVANEAMVSVATVSRVLNDNKRVSEATAKRVLDAVKHLGYVPNLSARNLRKKENKTVLIMGSNFTNPYYSNILVGICDAAQVLGYSAFINSGDHKTQEKAIINMVGSKRADGVIFLSCSCSDIWLNKYVDKFPMVQCAEAADDVAVPFVSIDNYSAMCDLVKYVRDLGHERIAYVNIDNDFLSTRLRKQGYCDSLSAGLFGRKPSDGYIIETADYGYESGLSAAEALLTLRERPTAILCGSDMLALGVLSKAREMGISVPAELSVTGFDDVEFTKMFHPYLTTVMQPCYKMGWSAMQKLKDCIAKSSNDNTHIVMPYKLEIRESCALVPAGM